MRQIVFKSVWIVVMVFIATGWVIGATLLMTRDLLLKAKSEGSPVIKDAVQSALSEGPTLLESFEAKCRDALGLKPRKSTITVPSEDVIILRALGDGS